MILDTKKNHVELQEVQRIKYEHLDDSSAIMNDRVKGSLKVTRAFGAGFLKQVIFFFHFLCQEISFGFEVLAFTAAIHYLLTLSSVGNHCVHNACFFCVINSPNGTMHFLKCSELTILEHYLTSAAYLPFITIDSAIETDS